MKHRAVSRSSSLIGWAVHALRKLRIAEIRGQELVGESFYEITPDGIAMLREAGRPKA